VKLLSDYVDVCEHNPPTLQTERQTDRLANDVLIAILCYAHTCFMQ